jgi:hypothetical protein
MTKYFSASTTIARSLVCAAAISGCGYLVAQPTAPQGDPNRVLEERLRNATVTEQKTEGGQTFTRITFAGSLKPNVAIGCIDIGEVKSDFNPPALVEAAAKCVREEQFAKAWALLTTGLGYAHFDINRLADRSAHGARQVMIANVFGGLPQELRMRASRASTEIQSDAEKVKAYCAALTKLGPPTYEPSWAILHGIGAYSEPRNGHYLTNVDTKALWEEVLKNRCTVTQRQ